jgi:ABC-type nitrate/sulfonate/bicarbonate transport system permease component
MPLLFAGILVLAGAGIAMTAAFRALERYLVPWHYQ